MNKTKQKTAVQRTERRDAGSSQVLNKLTAMKLMKAKDPKMVRDQINIWKTEILKCNKFVFLFYFTFHCESVHLVHLSEEYFYTCTFL